MKTTKSLDAIVFASSLLLATTVGAAPTAVGRAAPPKVSPPAVCGEVVLIGKVGAIATDLFTDCPYQAEKCLTLLQRNVSHSASSFLELTDETTKAAARECIEKFESELFGAE